MELKRRYSFRRIVTVLYVMAFAIYLIIGLQPAEATNYEISGELTIPSINLQSDVTTLKIKDHRLDTPDTIVGSYSRYNSKIFLVGHSSTVFQDLDRVSIGDEIIYDEDTYIITEMETLIKSDIDMDNLLGPADEKTIIIMTCAGEPLGGQDATHRLIVTAVRV